MADTDPNVTASPKKIMPDAATGSLFSAPTILLPYVSFAFEFCTDSSYLYVVLLVVRTHHAVVYDIPTAAAPEKAIAKSRKLRVSGGLCGSLASCHGSYTLVQDSQITGQVL